MSGLATIIQQVNPIEVLGVTTSVIGSLYITQRDSKAFAFWIVAGLALFIVMMEKGLYLTAALNVYYTLNSAYGYMNWKRLERIKV